MPVPWLLNLLNTSLDVSLQRQNAKAAAVYVPAEELFKNANEFMTTFALQEDHMKRPAATVDAEGWTTVRSRSVGFTSSNPADALAEQTERQRAAVASSFKQKKTVLPMSVAIPRPALTTNSLHSLKPKRERSRENKSQLVKHIAAVGRQKPHRGLVAAAARRGPPTNPTSMGRHGGLDKLKKMSDPSRHGPRKFKP